MEVPMVVARAELPSGNAANALVTKWTPTEEDLERLNDGGSVFLHVLGRQHPPVLLSTEMLYEPVEPPDSGGNGAVGDGAA